MSIIVETPFQNFTGLDGKPLTNGKVYIGQVGTDPTVFANQIPVFWDEALTIPASQPMITNAGYIVRFGTPARVWVATDYSISVKNSGNILVYYVSSITHEDFVTFDDLSSSSASSLIGEQSPATASIPTTVHGKLLDFGISLKADFGAVGNAYSGATDDTNAVQKFMNAQEIDTRTGFIPDGSYSVSNIQLGNSATTGTRYPPAGQGPGVFHLHGTDRQRSVFVARAGTTTVLERKNLAGAQISDIGVDGAGIASTCLNLDWVIDGTYPNAPANNNTLRNIFATGATVVNISLRNFNDSVVDNIRTNGAPIGLSMIAGGGQINLSNSNIGGLYQVCAQNIGIIDSTFYDGIDVNGNSNNRITIVEGQVFPIKVNFSIPSYKSGAAIDCTDAGTYGATITIQGGKYFSASGSPCISGKFFGGIQAKNATFSYGSSLFGVITSGGSSPALMEFDTCEINSLDATPTGMLGVNTSSYKWIIRNSWVNGVYIKYASNLTEGTWTPAGAGVTLTVNGTATWSLSGNMVTAFFDVSIPTNSSVNPGVISGLPFSIAGTGAAGEFAINTYSTARLTLDVETNAVTPRNVNATIPTYGTLTGIRFKGFVTYLCTVPLNGV